MQNQIDLKKFTKQNILPFLKMGYVYDIAVVLGGVKNVFGAQWDSLELHQKDFIIDNIPSIVRTKIKGGFIDTIKNVLNNEFGFDEKQLKKLYHHSAVIEVGTILDKLPITKEADKQLQAIKNPIVITALFELRKLVNELIDEFGKIDEIIHTADIIWLVTTQPYIV